MLILYSSVRNYSSERIFRRESPKEIWADVSLYSTQDLMLSAALFKCWSPWNPVAELGVMPKLHSREKTMAKFTYIV